MDFERGDCAVLALRLRELTGFPLVGMFEGGDLHHVAVEVDRGHVLDIAGVTAKRERAMDAGRPKGRWRRIDLRTIRAHGLPGFEGYDTEELDEVDAVAEGLAQLQRNAKKVVYAAVFLDESSREELLEWWSGRVGHVLLPKLYAHHMTIAFKPSPEVLGLLPLGEPVQVHVVGWGDDGQVQAVVVQANIPSANPVPHVTVATAEGVSPAHSNVLLSDPSAWSVVYDGPVLRGTVGTFP